MNDRATLEANKQLVLDMWHEVIVRRDLAKAGQYIARDYVQHSPSAGQGLDALVAFLKVELGGDEPHDHPVERTTFELVMAEGDLVQLMFKRPVPDPHRARETLHVWWYDTYRVRDGLIVEHWDWRWSDVLQSLPNALGSRHPGLDPGSSFPCIADCPRAR